MATEQWVDQERAIWKRLPLHPQPQPLESFTSYIMHLAETNGLKSINELGLLAGGGWSRARTSPDFPCPPYEGLARIAGCMEARLEGMTFLHLAQHFGCSLHSQPLHRFLRRSLAPTLRYCPGCLAEQSLPYYSLIWRFAAVPGCIKHCCALLDHCGQCQSPIPLFPLSPRIAWCPTCQGDLRTCRTRPLSHKALQSTLIRTRDLEMLLTPQQWVSEYAQVKTVGKRFVSLRQQRGFSTAEVAHLMGVHERVILDIEYPNRHREATFGDYMQYADVLEYSLREIFNVDHLQALLAPLSEEQVLDQVEAAVQQLQARGEPITQRGIGDLVGMPASRLKQCPPARTLLNRYHWERSVESATCDFQREEELVKQVEHIIKELEACGEPVIQDRICALVGLTYKWMRQFPRIKALFRQYQESLPKRRRSPCVDEDAKVQQVQAAITTLISNGESVTLKRIHQMVGLTQKQLGYSLRVKALLAQYTGGRRKEAS